MRRLGERLQGQGQEAGDATILDGTLQVRDRQDGVLTVEGECIPSGGGTQLQQSPMEKGQASHRNLQRLVGGAVEHFADGPEGRGTDPGELVERVAASAAAESGELRVGKCRQGVSGPAKVGDVGGASYFGEISELPQSCGVR